MGGTEGRGAGSVPLQWWAWERQRKTLRDEKGENRRQTEFAKGARGGTLVEVQTPKALGRRGGEEKKGFAGGNRGATLLVWERSVTQWSYLGKSGGRTDMSSTGRAGNEGKRYRLSR